MATRKRRERTRPLIERKVSDDNFVHCVSLLGPIAAWASSITENQKITFNDRNCIHIAVEVALAFAQAGAQSDPKIAEAWAEVIRIRDMFRQADAERADLFGGAA